MKIKNCPKCKRLFSPTSGQLICPECMRAEEKEFEKVRDYLRENRGADLNVVSEETGVHVKKIFKYLREGRIEITDGMQGFLNCEKCGKSIKSGHYCRECSEKVSKKLSSAISSPTSENDKPVRQVAKMHIRRR